MRHTPGPWRYEGPDPFRDYNILPPDDHTGALGAVVNNGRPDAEVGANARLIAAAPTLLEALGVITACVEMEQRINPSAAKAWSHPLKVAYAALSKARGEQ